MPSSIPQVTTGGQRARRPYVLHPQGSDRGRLRMGAGESVRPGSTCRTWRPTRPLLRPAAWINLADAVGDRTLSTRTATFPLCHFGADWQKFTTLMFTPGMQRLRELDGILCSHQTYKQRAGGAYSGWQVDLRGGGRLSTRVQHLPRPDVLPPQRRHAEPQQSPRSLPGSCAHERTRRRQPTDNGGAPTRLATKEDDRSSERQLILRQRSSDRRPRRSPSV